MALTPARRYQPVTPINSDARDSRTLPGTYYYDPAIFEREKEKIFYKNWQFFAHTSQLREPGDYIAKTIIDQDIIVVRGQDMKLRAFYNVCPHRGATLIDNGAGNRKTFVCTYHNWTFGDDGDLKDSNGADLMPTFDPADYCLPELRVEEFGTHMVFINMNPEGPSLESMAGSIVEEFREAIPGYDDLVLTDCDPFDIDINWKIAIGNFAECYHCPFAHPEFMGSVTSLFETEAWINRVQPYYSSHIVYKARPKNRAYSFDLEKADMVNGYIWALWPNTLFMAWPPASNFIVFQIDPKGPENTFESLDYYFRNDPPTAKEKEVVKFHSDVVNEQDIAIIHAVQRGVKSLGFGQGRFVVDDYDSWRSEHGIHQFERMVWEALNGSD
jgi:choline monooxygenase